MSLPRHRYDQTGDTATCLVCGHVVSARVTIHDIDGVQYVVADDVHEPTVCGGPGVPARWPTWDETLASFNASRNSVAGAAWARARLDEEASDAFAALEWVLGQVWRAWAWSDIAHAKPVCVADRLVEIRPSMAGSWLLRTRALADERWELLRGYATEDEACAVALELIERHSLGVAVREVTT